MKILENISFWIQNARYHALAQSFWAALVAVCIATQYQTFNLKFALLAVFGVLFAHLSINLLDDYFDYKSGSVEKRNELKDVVRTGKCAYLANGKTEVNHIFIAASVFAVLALGCGFYLFLQKGFPVLVLAFIAGLLGLFYSAPPFKLSYNGLGELVVGLMFGPLLMNGVFYCATGTVSLQLLLISFAIGALVTNILYVHSIMDLEADKAVNKNTLAVVLQNNVFRIIAQVFFALYPYWIAIVGTVRYGMPKTILFTLLTLPHTIVLIKFMVEHVIKSKKTHVPQWWMGYMEQWDRIKTIGIDWFMIRWYLSRNIMIFFSMIVCAVYLFNRI